MAVGYPFLADRPVTVGYSSGLYTSAFYAPSGRAKNEILAHTCSGPMSLVKVMVAVVTLEVQLD